MIRRLTYLIAALASLLLTACSVYDDRMYGPNGEQKVKVSFVLALGSSDDLFTKAETWHPDDPTDDDNNIGYDPKTIGDEYDNQIDPGTLQVVFYHTTGKFVGKVNNLAYSQVGTTDEDRNLYKFTGTMLLDEDLVNSNPQLKMMVFANFPETQRAVINGGADVSGLQELAFTRFGGGKDTDFIPMWGVKTVDLNLSGDPGTTDLGTVYVLRAMAKVEVKLSEALSDGGYTLTSMTMNHLNASGYCLPDGAEDLPNTEALSLGSSINVNSTPLEDQTVESQEAQGVQSLVMYVPEYKNDGSGNRATISLVLKQNENGVMKTLLPESVIEFKEYDGSGKPVASSDYDIVRNHNYVFEIKSLKEDGLKFLVTIEDLELGGRYGFEY